MNKKSTEQNIKNHIAELDYVKNSFKEKLLRKLRNKLTKSIENTIFQFRLY